MKFIFSILLLFIIPIAIFATDKNSVKTPPKEAFQDAAKRTTIIVLQAEDPKKVLLLKKTPDDLTFYKEDIEYFNLQLQNAVKKYWKFTEKYEFHTPAEVKKITAGKKSQDYVLLQWIEKNENPVDASAPIAIGLPFKKLSTDEHWGCFELRLAEMSMPGKPELINVHTTMIAPLYNDDVFSLIILQYELTNHTEGYSEADIKKSLSANSQMLTSKTLLVDQKDIDPEEFGTTKIKKKFYPYPTELVPTDSLYAKLMAGGPDYAVVKIILNDNHELVHYIISCEDSVFCMVYVSKYIPKQKRKQRINADVLKGYLKYIK